MWAGIVVLLALACLSGCLPAPPPPTARPVGPPQAAPAIAPPAGQPAPAATSGELESARSAGVIPTGTATVIQQLPIVSLDSSIEVGMATLNPAGHIFDSLTVREPNGDVKPFLATSWSYPNNTTLRLKIRSGVRFHNGALLTVDDVIFTLQRIADPANHSRHLPYLKAIDELRRIDGETVDVLLKVPDATLLGRFSLLPILPRRVVEALGADEFAQRPVGTGPWRFREWIKGQRLVLDANLDYWRGPPRIQTIVFRSIADDAARAGELLAGQADLVNNLPPPLAAQVRATPACELQTIRGLRNVFLKLNTRKSPYSDVRVRQAIAHALDLRTLTGQVLDHNAVPTPGGVMGPGVWGFYRDVDKGYEYDPAKARQLLAAAGVPPGFPVTLLSSQGRLLADTEVAQAIAALLGQVGLATSVQLVDFTTLTNDWIRAYRPELDLAIWSSANGTADADYNYALNFHSGALGYYWSTPETDGLIDRARATLDPDARQKIYQEIGARFTKEVPVVPLYDQVDSYGLSRRLHGFKARADELINLYDATVTK